MSWDLIFQHLFIVLAASLLSIAVGLPLGIWAYVSKTARPVILRIVDLLQTIPSLALLGIIMVVLDPGKLTVITGITLYSLLPIVRNTCLGLQEVDPGVKEAARGFYEREIRMRRLRRFPPFADLFTFTVSGTEEGAVLRAAVAVREELRRLCALPELAAGEPEVLGPAPAPVMKLNNRYRYRCLLVGKNDRPTREAVSWLLKAFANDRANRGMNLFVDCNSME